MLMLSVEASGHTVKTCLIKQLIQAAEKAYPHQSTMFDQQTMFDGVWAKSISRLLRS